MTKYIIIAFAVVAAVCAGLFLWERNTVVKQAGQISALQVENTGLIGQVQAAQKNIEAQKKLAAQYQQVAVSTAKVLAEIKTMDKIIIGGKNAKIICDAIDYFNNAGVLQSVSGSGAKTSGEVLPTASKTSACGAGVEWSAEQVTEVLLIMIDYSLDWEKTGVCYETP